ncbi:uncharacterized protein DNG_10499 [Cephalotrichum gorgonifer]|uniref:Uncharacterized protein n=1 Tax=Cephalotrichum gorgonifer TaxID=2041049 RepID=A0AAE8N8U8_9PEZI|nr:uncharacterized protein DNG_10499 [Cephalotrichum gorgonifer]
MDREDREDRRQAYLVYY